VINWLICNLHDGTGTADVGAEVGVVSGCLAQLDLSQTLFHSVIDN